MPRWARSSRGKRPGASATLPPVIAVQHLMPTKARILMMLALTKTQNPVEIQRIFDSY